MGFLSRILGYREARSSWADAVGLPGIASIIANTLEATRRYWFDQAVDLLEGLNTDNAPAKPRIRNRSLGGEADFAVKAFQFLFALLFVERHSYVPAAKMEDFVDALYTRICETETARVAGYLKRYEYEGAGSIGTMLNRFANDLASYMMEEETAIAGGLLLLPLVEGLVFSTQIAIAQAFGDGTTVDRLAAQSPLR